MLFFINKLYLKIKITRLGFDNENIPKQQVKQWTNLWEVMIESN